MELTIQDIRRIGKALSNERKVQLLNLCADKQHNITELKRLMLISMQSISRYVKELETAGLIETKEVITERGRNVMVRSLYRIKSNGILEEL